MTAKSDEEIYAEKSYLRALARKNGRVSKPQEVPAIEYLPEDDAVVDKPKVVTKRNRKGRTK